VKGWVYLVKYTANREGGGKNEHRELGLKLLLGLRLLLLLLLNTEGFQAYLVKYTAEREEGGKYEHWERIHSAHECQSYDNGSWRKEV
jgi:hypothetical protein